MTEHGREKDEQGGMKEKGKGLREGFERKGSSSDE